MNHADFHGCDILVLSIFSYVQNHCARIILRKRKHDHITEGLISLHWLPVKYRLQYKMLLLTFKCLHKEEEDAQPRAPVYLADLLEPYVQVHSLRSQRDQDSLVEPFVPRNSYGDLAFSVCGPVLWNTLPNEVKSANSIDGFKSLLKTHLFREAYLT